MGTYAVNTDVGIYLFDNPDSATKFADEVGKEMEYIYEYFPDCLSAMNHYNGRREANKVMDESMKEQEVCPFCGGTNIRVCDGRYNFHCYDCGNEFD